MDLDPRLLEILCCPATRDGRSCHGNLKPEQEGLRCQACGLLYPIQDGIPVLLPDQARH